MVSHSAQACESGPIGADWAYREEGDEGTGTKTEQLLFLHIPSLYYPFRIKTFWVGWT